MICPNQVKHHAPLVEHQWLPAPKKPLLVLLQTTQLWIYLCGVSLCFLHIKVLTLSITCVFNFIWLNAMLLNNMLNPYYDSKH